MPIPTNQELDAKIELLSWKARLYGATNEEILALGGVPTTDPRMGRPEINPDAPEAESAVTDVVTPESPISNAEGFSSGIEGFSSDVGGGFVTDRVEGIGKLLQRKVKEKTIAVSEKTVQKQKQLGMQPDITQSVVTDLEMSNTSGQLLNLANSGLNVGVKQLSATLWNVIPAAIVNNQLKHITDDDLTNYVSAQAKNEQRKLLDQALELELQKPASAERDRRITSFNEQLQQQRLTDDEDALFREQEKIVRVGKHNKTVKSEAVGSRIARMEEARGWIENFNQVVDDAQATVNTRFSAPAEKKLKAGMARTVAKWGEEDYLDSIAEFGKSFAELATEDTYAATQAFVQSVPLMIGLIVAGPVVIPAEAIRYNDESVEDYRKEYGALPTEEEKSTIKLISVARAFLDRAGA